MPDCRFVSTSQHRTVSYGVPLKLNAAETQKRSNLLCVSVALWAFQRALCAKARPLMFDAFEAITVRPNCG